MKLDQPNSGETSDILDSFKTPLEPFNNYLVLKFCTPLAHLYYQHQSVYLTL